MPERGTVVFPFIPPGSEVRVRLLVVEREHPQQGRTTGWVIGTEILGQGGQHCQGGLLTREQAAAISLGDLSLRLALSVNRTLKALGARHVTVYLHTRLVPDSERGRLSELDETVHVACARPAPTGPVRRKWTQVWDTLDDVAQAAGYTGETVTPGRALSSRSLPGPHRGPAPRIGLN